LRDFLLKKVEKNGFLHIIEKPHAMNRPTMKIATPNGRCGAGGHPITRPVTLGRVPFLPRDSAPKWITLVEEGVSFGRCHPNRRLSNDVADGQSGCKRPFKGESTRLNQACKKEVLCATFF